jgi:hypothetical protein
MHLRFDELNKAYADLVRKFREINRERNEFMGTIEDLCRANKMMEQDFMALFKQVNAFRDHKEGLKERMMERLSA